LYYRCIMNKKLLVVDDTPDLLSNLVDLLRMEGYEVASFKDAKSGLDHLQQWYPDLVITDLSMPDMDGFEFIEIIKKKYPEMKVAIFSARPAEENFARSLSLDVVKYIRKPCIPDELITILEQIFSRTDK
jgi:CheY-like chemotaxis protein